MPFERTDLRPALCKRTRRVLDGLWLDMGGMKANQ